MRLVCTLIIKLCCYTCSLVNLQREEDCGIKSRKVCQMENNLIAWLPRLLNCKSTTVTIAPTVRNPIDNLWSGERKGSRHERVLIKTDSLMVKVSQHGFATRLRESLQKKRPTDRTGHSSIFNTQIISTTLNLFKDVCSKSWRRENSSEI